MATPTAPSMATTPTATPTATTSSSSSRLPSRSSTPPPPAARSTRSRSTARTRVTPSVAFEVFPGRRLRLTFFAFGPQDSHIYSTYKHQNSEVRRTADGGYEVKPTSQTIEFKTTRKVPKTGSALLPHPSEKSGFELTMIDGGCRLMLVGLGGNNGTTLAATVLANKHNISWNTRDGVQTPNYIGSLVRAATCAFDKAFIAQLVGWLADV